MNMTCEHARGLVPGYLDGELSSERSQPLREHLLDCRSCRDVAKEEKVIKRWFAQARVDAASAEPVPAGFAARVARRAFAGDPGSAVLAGSGGGDAIGWAAATGGFRPSEREDEEARGTLLSFVLKSVLVAAGLLLALAIGIQQRELPQDDLRALPAAPWERPGAVPRESGSPEAGRQGLGPASTTLEGQASAPGAPRASEENDGTREDTDEAHEPRPGDAPR